MTSRQEPLPAPFSFKKKHSQGVLIKAQSGPFGVQASQSIIAGGVAHSEKNSIGDRGIPVVTLIGYEKAGNKYNREFKTAELESEEIVLSASATRSVLALIETYQACKCPKKLLEIGQLMKEELKNIKDETCRTGCKFEPIIRKIR